MKNYVLLMLGACVLFSCSSKEQYQNAQLFDFKDFKTEIKLKGKVLDFDDPIMHPGDIQIYDSILVTIEYNGEKVCNIYNLNTKRKMGERLSRGQGPDEMLMPLFIDNDGLSVQIIDMATSTIYKYDLEDFINNLTPKPIFKLKLEENINSSMQIIGENIVGHTYFKQRQLYVFNAAGKKIRDFADFPPSSISYSDIEKADAYYMGAVSNGMDRVAICYYMTDLIEIYDSIGNLRKRIHGPEHFFAYFEEVHDGNELMSKPVRGKNKDAYFSPENAGDCFFVLYNGRSTDEENHNSYCDKLFSFSWNGEPLNRYLLDDPVFTFCIDKKRKKIYGVSNVPDCHIVEYTY